MWGPDFALGFGYPVWLVYAPLAYFIAEAFHLLGFGITAAVKLTWALSFLLGSAGAYALGRNLFGRRAALITALAFTYAPYRFVQIYVRADLAEFVSLSIFPFTLLAFIRLWQAPSLRRVAAAAVALAALFLSHTGAPLILGSLLGAYLLFELAQSWLPGRRFPWPRALPAAGALLLGVMLVSIYLVPAFFERRFVAESQWTYATYNYRQHFVYPNQLLSPFWGFGHATAGPEDGMSFQLGLLPFAGAALAGALVWSGGRKRQRPLVLFLLGLTLVIVLAMMPLAAWAWDTIPLVKMLQFPWRLLSMTTVTLALLCGAAAAWLADDRTSPAWVYAAALAIVLAGSVYAQAQIVPVTPADEGRIAVIQFETKYADMRGMTRWSERVPQDGDSPLLQQYLAGAPLERAAIAQGNGTIIAQGAGAASAWATVDAAGPLQLRFYTYYFPGWYATVDGLPVPIAPAGPNALIHLDVPAGRHDVRLAFGSTPLRTASLGISVLAALAIAGIAISKRQIARSN